MKHKYTNKRKTRNIKTRNTKTRNTKTRNTKTRNTKTRNTKRKTRKTRNTKRKTRSKSRRTNKKYKGGELAVTPFKMFEFPHGASSESQAALLTGKAKSQEQYDMNKIGGGDTLEVPQFYPPGGIKTAYTATNLSADGNLASLVGEVDSTNDHFAQSQVAGKKHTFKKQPFKKQPFKKRLSQKYSFYAK